MNTVAGLRDRLWEQGYGDFEFVLDIGHAAAASRGCPAPAMVQCDLHVARRLAGAASPRDRSCGRQVDRAAELG